MEPQSERTNVAPNAAEILTEYEETLKAIDEWVERRDHDLKTAIITAQISPEMVSHYRNMTIEELADLIKSLGGRDLSNITPEDVSDIAALREAVALKHLEANRPH